MDSGAIVREMIGGFVKGVTGEGGKVTFQGLGSALMGKQQLKTGAVSMEAVPAPTPVIGTKKIRLQVEFDVKDTIETVGTPKVLAEVIFGHPVIVKMVMAHVLVSMALVTMWHHLAQVYLGWFKEDEES